MKSKKESIQERVVSMGFNEKALMARRATLISLLRSLQKSLEQNDTMTDGTKSLVEEKQFSKSAGIKSIVRKPNSTLSHRGVQLSEGLHRHFDRSNKGGMTFKEFRGYLASVGRRKEMANVTDNQESWRLFFDDMDGLDERGLLTEEGYVKYRVSIENTHALEQDLLKIKLPLLPDDILSWSRNMRAFDVIDEEGVEIENKKLARRLGKKKAAEVLKWGAIGKINVSSLQQLLADCREWYTIEQLNYMMFVQQAFQDVVAQLRARFKRKNEFNGDLMKSNVDADDKDNIYRDAFGGWAMSGREKPAPGNFERYAIWMKTSAIRLFRSTSRQINSFRSSIEALVDREILTPRILGGLKMDLSRWEGLATIGDADEVDDGMSLRIVYGKVERAATEFAANKLPRGAGTAFVLDFLQRSDATEQEVKNAVTKLTAVLKEHFERDISCLPLFHSWKVFNFKSEVDNISVIRCALCFDKTASIDYALRELDMGFSFADLLTELTAELKCSLNITDLLDSKRVSLEKNLHLKATAVVGGARGLAVKILEEYMLGAEEAAKTSENIRGELDNNYREYDKRTMNTHPSNPEYGAIRIGLNEEKVSKTGKELEAMEKERESNRRMLWRALNFLRGTKGTLIELSFKNISDCIFGSRFVKRYTPEWLKESFFKEQGQATIAWRSWCRDTLAFMQGTIADGQRHAEEVERERKDREEKENKVLGGMSEMERRRKQLAADKKKLAMKLEKLGIKMDPNLLKTDKGPVTFADQQKAWRTRQVDTRNELLNCYAAVQQCCVGIQGIMVLSGTNKFEVQMQGWDIFEVFPELEIDFDD